MHQELHDIVNQSLEKARKLKTSGNYGHAYAHYTVVVELCQEKREEVEEEFTDVLCKWGMVLEKTSTKKTLMCYKHSLDIYPQNARMLNNCAAHYLRQDLPKNSVLYLKRALKVNPDFLPAQWNLQYAHSLLVERWHFPMLNDRQRNVAFERAIRNRIAQGYDTVLDIGSGTGLLSLYAKDAGAKRVYACEYLEEMSCIAKRVFLRNNADDIALFPLHSTSLHIPQHIPERVKLVVTETFDAGLFGELVLSTMVHAHENLLDQNSTGMVIPMGASLFVAAIESEHIRFRSSVNYYQPCTSSLNFNGISVVSDNKYYDTVTLNNVPTRFITEPREILRVNINDLSQLQKIQANGVKGVVRGECLFDGVIDGLVSWFRLYLDEEISLDTSHQGSCWQHAVFPGHSTPCSQGETLTIMALIHQEKLKCSYTSEINSSRDQGRDNQVYHVPQEVITFLNDTEYVSSITRIAHLHKENHINNILDACPFPIYGLELLKCNLNSKILYCYAKTEQLTQLIRKIVKNSGIKGDIFIVNSLDDIDGLLDVIFEHNFSTEGEIKDWDEPRSYGALRIILSPTGFILPSQIILVGVLGFSEDLPKMVLVDDDNIQRESFPKDSEYILGDLINEYGCIQRFDLNASLYQFQAMSDNQVLLQIDRNKTTENIVNFGRFDSMITPLPNVLLCWYDICLDMHNIVSSKRNNSFMNHSAIGFKDELRDSIIQGEEVRFKILQMKGLTRITLMVSNKIDK